MAGIIDTITFAGTLILAVPAALAGLELVARGNTVVGATLVGLAVGLVVLERYLTSPTDLPGLLAKRVVGAVVKKPDTESNED